MHVATTRRFLSLLLTFAPAVAACTVGPDYERQPAPVPEAYKELRGWKIATPRDAIDRGPWWSVFRDSKLDWLAGQVEISNQTVAQSAAAYEQARALIREAQASLFPTVTASYNVTRTHTGSGAGSGTSGAAASVGRSITTTIYNPEANASWSPDVWGKIRRQIESNIAGAQASAADLANAKLSAQAQLAIAYFNLRAADSLQQLLRRTIGEYQRTLEITQNQYKTGGTVTRADVATAETQLLSTQAQEINVGVQRAAFEHAIAVLIGRPPAELTVAPHFLAATPPKVPVNVPSTLLERRPDIAAAERAMQEQNALIGVAVAGYYPNITLTGNIGFIGRVPLPFHVANLVWSLGASGTETLFNGGLTGAQVDAARATYWQSVATYRQTVLTAFQQVEDQLAAIRILNRQLRVENQAVKAAREAVDVFLNQYRVGTVAFTAVVVAQAALLNNEEAALAIRQNLFIATVTLIEALGGGWEQLLLPGPDELAKGVSLLPQL
jgi:NodT family efflux transporter outer membrane factor (OMF) lipoprotein